MKNIKTLWMAVGLGLLAVGVHAQMGRADKDFKVPVDVNSVAAPSIDYHGVAVSTANAAGTVSGNQVLARTVSRLFFAGEGVFYGIAISSGAVGDWAACWDKATADETLDPFDITDTTLVGAVQAVTTEWRYNGAGGGSAKGGPPPVKIRSGLVCDSTLATVAGVYIPYFEKK